MMDDCFTPCAPAVSTIRFQLIGLETVYVILASPCWSYNIGRATDREVACMHITANGIVFFPVQLMDYPENEMELANHYQVKSK